MFLLRKNNVYFSNSQWVNMLRVKMRLGRWKSYPTNHLIFNVVLYQCGKVKKVLRDGHETILPLSCSGKIYKLYVHRIEIGFLKNRTKKSILLRCKILVLPWTNWINSSIYCTVEKADQIEFFGVFGTSSMYEMYFRHWLTSDKSQRALLTCKNIWDLKLDRRIPFRMSDRA